MGHSVVSHQTQEVIATALRLVVAAVWITAALSKVRESGEVRREAVQRLLGGPTWAVRTISTLLVPLELALGLAMLAAWPLLVAATVSAALFVAFGVAVFVAALRGALAEGGGCGCFGGPARAATPGSAVPSGVTVTPVERSPEDDAQRAGPRLLARNLVLAMFSLAAAAG